MKKIMLIVVLFLVACGNSNEPESLYEMSYAAPPPEGALLAFVTDIVIAQYVGSRPFGQNWTEFEFTVSERILGNATDRIFVFFDHTFGSGSEANQALTFRPGSDYLLPLRNSNSPYSNQHNNADHFLFIYSMMMNSESPLDSMMYREILNDRVVRMSFDEGASSQEIISFVKELAEQIEDKGRWETVFIHSTAIEDIIKGSPYVWMVEIGEPLRLSHEQSVTDWGLTDIYHITVIQSLKGDINLGDELVMTFFADTVLPGEQHIVAVQPLAEDDNWWFRFTSRNSLFRMDQLEEIMQIIDSDH